MDIGVDMDMDVAMAIFILLRYGLLVFRLCRNTETIFSI
jgi:hypothetical protein